MEEGLVPICFEKLDCVGGLWSYTIREMTYFSDLQIYVTARIIIKRH